MWACHDWLSALAVANGKARATGRRQHVRWSPTGLAWTVAEARR